MIGAQPGPGYTRLIARRPLDGPAETEIPAKPVRAGDFQADSRVFTTTEWLDLPGIFRPACRNNCGYGVVVGVVWVCRSSTGFVVVVVFCFSFITLL